MSQLPTNSYKRIPANLLVTQLPWKRGHIHTEETVIPHPRPHPHKLVGHQLAIFKYQLLGYVTLDKLGAQPGVDESLHRVGELPSHRWRLCGATEGQMTRLLASKSGLVNLLSSLGRLTHDHKDMVFCCSFNLHLFKKENHH